MESIRIYTYLDNESLSIFNQLKRKKRLPWQFVMAGEWAATPMAEGYTTFLFSHTPDERYWALLERSFPTRIVAMAEVPPGFSKETILGEMARKVEEDGGPYIEFPEQYPDEQIDFDLLWKIYKGR